MRLADPARLGPRGVAERQRLRPGARTRRGRCRSACARAAPCRRTARTSRSARGACPGAPSTRRSLAAPRCSSPRPRAPFRPGRARSSVADAAGGRARGGADAAHAQQRGEREHETRRWAMTSALCDASDARFMPAPGARALAGILRADPAGAPNRPWHVGQGSVRAAKSSRTLRTPLLAIVPASCGDPVTSHDARRRWPRCSASWRVRQAIRRYRREPTAGRRRPPPSGPELERSASQPPGSASAGRAGRGVGASRR